ncbi:MAG TPA: 50S ribosomal protein L21 [Anaerolineales bacterium]|nr:50S ribosomal protein L21 [Anaerolineales bacterium]
MRYAIVESGGKQYKAVEGQTIEVDRLADKQGAQVDLLALLMADGEEVMVGTPTIGGLQVRATVMDHFRGEKIFRFKYSPKKRIRVRGGHRQQYTRLMVDFIGRPGETRKVEKVEPKPFVEKEAEPKAREAEAEPKARAPQPKAAATSARKKAAAGKPERSSEKKTSTKKSSKSTVR